MEYEVCASGVQTSQPAMIQNNPVSNLQAVVRMGGKTARKICRGEDGNSSHEEPTMTRNKLITLMNYS